MTASFATAEGLRQVLTRLHDLESVGHWAWRTDPEAERLMRFTIGKYRWLASNHHCEPEDSAYAAFEAMRTRAVRTAEDPWAVVTRAVQVSLIAEERANGLLCSPAQARRRQVSRNHDARRFSESATDLLASEPRFRNAASQAEMLAELEGPDQPELAPGEQRPTTAVEAVNQTIALFIALGWPEETATCALDYVTARLVEAGTRPAAHAVLRRDQTGRASLDLDRVAWSTLLRLVLGNPDADQTHTRAGHGVLVLLLVGYPLIELLADDALVAEISQTAPRIARRSHAEPA